MQCVILYEEGEDSVCQIYLVIFVILKPIEQLEKPYGCFRRFASEGDEAFLV